MLPRRPRVILIVHTDPVNEYSEAVRHLTSVQWVVVFRRFSKFLLDRYERLPTNNGTGLKLAWGLSSLALLARPYLLAELAPCIRTVATIDFDMLPLGLVDANLIFSAVSSSGPFVAAFRVNWFKPKFACNGKATSARRLKLSDSLFHGGLQVWHTSQAGAALLKLRAVDVGMQQSWFFRNATDPPIAGLHGDHDQGMINILLRLGFFRDGYANLGSHRELRYVNSFNFHRCAPKPFSLVSAHQNTFMHVFQTKPWTSCNSSQFKCIQKSDMKRYAIGQQELRHRWLREWYRHMARPQRAHLHFACPAIEISIPKWLRNLSNI